MTYDMMKDMILHKIGQWVVRPGRTGSPAGADWKSAWGGLRTTLLLLMLILGVGSTWGQEPVGPDRSGYYYIINYTIESNSSPFYLDAPQNGYYLCPAAPPANPAANYNYDAVYYDGTDKQMPYLTTYKKGRVNDAVWKIEFAETDNTDIDNPIDYYYIRYCSDNNKYLTHNTSRTNVPNRLTVHLQTENGGNNSMFCFETGRDDASSFFIRPRQVSSGERHLNPPQQNYNYYYGTGGKKTAKINNVTIDVGGMIGYYTSTKNPPDDPASQWYLEKAAPIISYNSSSLIEISYIFDEGASIYYSYGEDSTPSPSSEGTYSYSVPFDPPAGTTTIKAIAKKGDEVSGIATYTIPFLLGSTHKYLIQAQENGWTTGEFQGCHYYMIPGDVESSITKLNTTTMLRPSMQWYILNAGDNYYYIVNNVDNTRMRYNTTIGVHMDTWDNGNADEFKFKIVESATAGTYNIIPYGAATDYKYLNKASSNTSPNALGLHNIATQANSRWKFVSQDTPLADTPPFTPSEANTTVYYKIKNGNSSNGTYYITPPASADGNITASATDDATVSWYFIQVEDPTTTDWLAYYRIINAGTGKALYYAYTADNKPCLKVGDYDGSNDDYKFAFVKSPTADYYYIVPKSHKDDQLNNISTFYRNNSSIYPATTRAANNNVWTFIPADLFCNDPEFVEEEGVIKIKCNTNGAKIYINTESDDSPTTDNDHLYDPINKSDQNWATTDKVRIKAIAVVSDGTNTSSSSVFTLLNNPDITLGGTAPYIYKASPWEPGVTEVSIGEAPNKTSTTSGYSVSYSENHTDAGVVTVNVTDNVEDGLFIKNASTTFTIQRKGVTITASDASKTYTGSALTEGGFAATALEGSDTHEFTVVMTEGSTITNVGTQPNVIASVDGVDVTTGTETAVGNYLVTTADGMLTVNPKAVTITAKDASKTYNGSALTESEFTASALEDGDTHSFTVVMTDASTITNVGTQPNEIATVDGVAVTTGAETAVGNYLVTTADGTLTVNPKDVTITASNASKSYDGTPLTEGGFTATPLETGDTHEFTVAMTAESTITEVGTQPNVIATVDGVAVTTGTQTAVGNYLVTTVNGTLTISKAVLTVTAKNKTITYGDAPANDGVTYDGFLNNETSSVLGGTLAYAYTYDQYGDVGNYLITPSGLTSDKYDITFVKGTLTVEQKEVGIEWSTAPLTYNGSTQTPAATATGTVNGDAIGVTVTGGRSDANDSNDPYTATASGLDGTKAGNYKLPSTGLTQDFSINQAQLMTVTLSDTSLPYTGEAQTVTITGVTAGDGTNVTVADVPSTAYTVDPSGSLSRTDQGTLTVTVTAAGTNYTGSAQATFTITAKSIGDGTDPETGITVDIDTSTTPYTVTVKQGGTPLTVGTEYTTEKTAEDAKYIEYTVTGTGNYGGEFKTKYAKVSFDSNGSAGASWYGTFVADADHAKPAGMTPYIITNITGNTATAVELDYIPSGVPVVLMNSADASGFKVVSGSGTPPAVNLLKEVGASTPGYDSGTEKAHFDVAQIYVLYKGEFVLNKDGNLAKGKVYMEKPSGGLARLKISKGDGTGIENIEYTIDPQSEAWYTLDGRRLSSKPTKKGLYLQSGKKIVVK